LQREKGRLFTRLDGKKGLRGKMIEEALRRKT
jgi:hypothetical protein